MSFVPKEIFSIPVDDELKIMRKNSTEKPLEGNVDYISQNPEENNTAQTKEKPLKGAKAIFIGDSFDITIRKFSLPPGSVVRNRRRK